MTTLLTTELIDRCHAGSRAKGFWDETPDQRQQLMLMIGELAEAQEAHRKGKRAVLVPNLIAHFTDSMGSPESAARELFANTIKDTPADELADAFIRGCDFAAGFWIAVEALTAYTAARYHHTANAAFIEPVPENFGAALYEINKLIGEVYYGRRGNLNPARLGEALACIERLAEREGIDLATHIDLKLRYNATRPAKHGKAY